MARGYVTLALRQYLKNKTEGNLAPCGNRWGGRGGDKKIHYITSLRCKKVGTIREKEIKGI